MSVLVIVAAGAVTGLFVGTLASKRRARVGEDRAESGGASTPERRPHRGSTSNVAEWPAGVVRPKPLGVPFAEGIDRPVWPLQTRHPRRGVVSYRGVDGKVRGNWARRFAAPRGGRNGKPARNHAGIDLFAYAGDPVVAMADGVVTAVQSFHLGSWAVFVEHGDVVVMYGEVEARSWRSLGVSVGSTVRAGQPIAAVACMVRGEQGECTSHMLHLETYGPGTTHNQRWYAGEAAPPALRDPSRLLLRAAQQPSTPAVA